MGLFATLLGSRLPKKYQKYFNLPARQTSFQFLNTDDTALGRASCRWLEKNPGCCGVLRLQLGDDALAVRIALIERAERSIDIQSYLLSDDMSGNLLVVRLAEAAERGVRIRLLMDDALTEKIDTGLLSLDDHENIEVRVFNPFPRRRSRFISFIANFNILNRRMHNKSFTVDGQVTIVGGRNLADEYFTSGGHSEFLDEDLFAIGDVVSAVAEGFDEYWNTPEAIPVDIFDADVPHVSVTDMTIVGEEYFSGPNELRFIKDISSDLIDRFVADELPLIPADVEMVMDRPDKIRRLIRQPTSRVSVYLQELVVSAETEVVIVSPYFVPQKRGVKFLSELVQKGAQVTVVTNSLASTNHFSVHAVYARYRKPLLRAGVRLFELRPRLDDSPLTGTLTLHSKVAIVDRQKSFVGSFNLDPRSLYLNTEMGLAVNSKELAEDYAESLLQQLPDISYELTMSETKRVLWHYSSPQGDVVSAREPHTSMWRRFLTRAVSFLPIESQM